MTITSQEELAGMERIGRLVGLTLREMKAAATPGMTTEELDGIGADFLQSRGARSAPQMAYGFPGFTCLSVNEEVVHGVPGPRRLQPGDVIKIDVTAELDGYVADAAVMKLLPPVSEQASRLEACAVSAFGRAMRAARAGNRVAEIGREVEAEVHRHGFRVLRDLAGHGVGRSIHEEPTVPNFFDRRSNARLREGMVIAVEPIFATGPARLVEEKDGWTLRTHNRCLAAHYEHTVVITQDGPKLLTAV